METTVKNAPTPISTSKRVNFWSSPRNISTALMYSFAQRSDFRVVDEPLYAHYLTHQPTDAVHPGRKDILDTQNNDGTAVVNKMLTHHYGTAAVLFKQMTHHLVNLDHAFLRQMDNVLLIRNPRAILSSFSKVVTEVTAEDIGLPQQYRLYQELLWAGCPPAVVDATRLLQDPRTVLGKLCLYLGIPWQDSMLSWPAGPRPEDGVWAPYWYSNVHRSTGFQPFVEKEYKLSDPLEAIARNCLPLYQELLDNAL